MKNLLFISLFALVLLNLTSCDQDEVVLQGENDYQEQISSERSNATVPFQGLYTVYPDVSGPDSNGTLTAVLDGDGRATHLGKSNWLSNGHVFGIFGPPPWLQTTTHVFTAANGDQLFGATVGTAFPDPPNPQAGIGTYTLDSCTGRFAGYTGEGTYSYFVTPDFIGHVEFEGTLTKP